MEIKTIRIKTIGTATEREIFERLKRFLDENLQNYELEVSGKLETLHIVTKGVENGKENKKENSSKETQEKI